MSTTEEQTTMTAEAALDEALNRVFGGFSHGWRDRLAAAEEVFEADWAQIHAGSCFTVGDLRRWSAPLRNS